MRLIHKSGVSVLLCMLSCVLLSGCKKNLYSNINNETEIEEITVDFDDENRIWKTVTVNLIENTKTTVLFQKEVIETTEDFDVEYSFIDFIKNTILTHSTTKTKILKNQEPQKVLWDITIRTNGDSYNLSGYDEYPFYWSELLEYMGER